MGRGSSGIGTGKSSAQSASGSGNGEQRQVRTLHSKSQVGELTADYTPEKFLGDVQSWTGTISDAQSLAEENMPKSLEIGGYTFNSMGKPDARTWSGGRDVVVLLDYQSNEKIGNEYPVIQIGVRMRKLRGKTKAEIVRDNPLYGTKFW